ncbi:MAG: hypothetical protein HC913_15925, partial [Microscillaceae bacterium]|nr:hypothetical protein [Microscillaceae bacterium]
SNNGGQNFVRIYDFNLNNLPNDTWVAQSLDLDSVMTVKELTFSDSMILRFQQFDAGDFNPANDEDGILLDNIRINVDPTASYATLPYFEDFTSGSFGSEWRISSREANDSLGTNYLTRFPRLQVAGTGGHIYMGKTADAEGDNLNAVDLHLILGTYADTS